MGLLRKLMFVEQLGECPVRDFRWLACASLSVRCGYPYWGHTLRSLLKQGSFAFLIFQYYYRIGLLP